jgi:hypothetical protein
MGLLETKWVLFKEDGATHREEYVVSVDYDPQTMRPKVEKTTFLSEAAGFESAAAAYAFAGIFEPSLDWWRAGLRGKV